MHLDTQRVTRIILQRKQGTTYELLARTYGTSVKAIYNICKGETFASACALHVWQEGVSHKDFTAATQAEMKARDEARYA